MINTIDLAAGIAAGEAAAIKETTIGNLFYGACGSLRQNHGGTGYEKTDFAIGYCNAYMMFIDRLDRDIVTDFAGFIVEG